MRSLSRVDTALAGLLMGLALTALASPAPAPTVDDSLMVTLDRNGTKVQLTCTVVPFPTKEFK